MIVLKRPEKSTFLKIERGEFVITPLFLMVKNAWTWKIPENKALGWYVPSPNTHGNISEKGSSKGTTTLSLYLACIPGPLWPRVGSKYVNCPNLDFRRNRIIIMVCILKWACQSSKCSFLRKIPEAPKNAIREKKIPHNWKKSQYLDKSWTLVREECGGELFTIYIFRALGDPRFSLVFQFPLRIEASRRRGAFHFRIDIQLEFFHQSNLLHTVLCSKSLVYKIV